MSHKTTQDKLKAEYPWTTRQKRVGRGSVKQAKKMAAAKRASKR